MAQKLTDRLIYTWRLLKFNWRTLIVMLIAGISIVVGLWGIYQMVTAKFGGLTMMYFFLVLACVVVFNITFKSIRGGFDFLLIDDED